MCYRPTAYTMILEIVLGLIIEKSSTIITKTIACNEQIQHGNEIVPRFRVTARTEFTAMETFMKGL